MATAVEQVVPSAMGDKVVLKDADLTLHVPIFDLAEDNESLRMAVREACKTIGFFLVKNHGVPEELLSRAFSEMRRFFSLPIERKMQVAASTNANNRGYTRWAEETLDVEKSTQGDTKEGYYIGREVPPDSPETSLPLHGPNMWPADLPGWRETMEEYVSAVITLSVRITHLLAMALDLPEDWFDQYFTRPLTALRPLHYSAELSDPAKGKFAAGEHSDYGMLTVLATDGTPGLQIKPRGCDRWIDVPTIPGTYVINLGDMLQRWTNDVFMSTPHRVVNVTATERYSLPFFYEPNYDTKVECLPSCCSATNPPKYEPCISGQHLIGKYSATHKDFANEKPHTMNGTGGQ